MPIAWGDYAHILQHGMTCNDPRLGENQPSKNWPIHSTDYAPRN